MTTLSDETSGWLPRSRDRLGALDPSPDFDHVGEVAAIGDGVATVTGLPLTRLDELVRFEDGTLGLAFSVAESACSCVLLGPGDGVVAGGAVHGTGEIIRTPVGEALLGRVVDPTGAPLDGGPSIEAERFDPIERPAPGIVDRAAVNTSLMTGITVVDAMIPIGRGQRELIVGDRKTGKTAVAVDAIVNQRDSDVVCVYAAIGQKASTINQVIEAVRAHGAFDRCIFVAAEADAAPGAQWIAPYAACAMAEYFRDKGRDALLVLDDLTKHAIIHRQISLLLRRPPGREAYPGDVFHLHSRLLERAAKLSPELGGGSLTALPVAETQGGDLTAYIPTNLISITDGQILLEPRLFYEGQKPAVNVGMSVSRVGGHSQTAVMKRLAASLKLEYAQFLELEVFTRFGAMVEDAARRKIEHGRRIRAMLIQPQYTPRSLAVQAALLFALGDGRLDALTVEQTALFRDGGGDWLASHRPAVMSRLASGDDLSDEDRGDLRAAIDACLADLVPPDPARAAGDEGKR